MSAKEITIIGYATVPEENHEQFLAHSAHMISLTRKEDGCIKSYVIQDITTPEKFMLYEEWESRESWTQHLQQIHIANFIEEVSKIGTEYQIQKFHKCDL